MEKSVFWSRQYIGKRSFHVRNLLHQLTNGKTVKRERQKTIFVKTRPAWCWMITGLVVLSIIKKELVSRNIRDVQRSKTFSNIPRTCKFSKERFSIFVFRLSKRFVRVYVTYCQYLSRGKASRKWKFESFYYWIEKGYLSVGFWKCSKIPKKMVMIKVGLWWLLPENGQETFCQTCREINPRQIVPGTPFGKLSI